MVRRTSVYRSIVTADWYADSAMIGASSPPDGTPGRRHCTHHHCWMVRWSGVNGGIITVGSYAGLASMDTSSPLDNTPSQCRFLHHHRRTMSQCRWMHHHRRMVHRTGIEGHIITVGWYAGPAVVRYHHHRMVCGANGGKTPSPLALYRRR
jgi:hypothetical protein